MFNKKNCRIPIDDFINNALYHPQKGYYIKKNPFGKNGDFITSPNISIIFSEIICIWIISFWKKQKKPEKINLIELGAGNGDMMYQILNSSINFKDFYNSCNFYIYEKSPHLTTIQKKRLNNFNVKWIKNFNQINKGINLFISNEFIDVFPIKQLIKIKNKWYERYIDIKNKKFLRKKINIKNVKKKYSFVDIKNQNFIEFSPQLFSLLRKISNKINISNGGMLIIDYAYNKKKMVNTLQSVKDHKKISIFDKIGDADISYVPNFNQIKKMAHKLDLKVSGQITQGEFLKKMGILKRAEIISENLNFLKKADLYYRIKRLIDPKFMGKLFKVLFLTNKKISFNIGFK